MIQVNVNCPHCKSSLMDESLRIDNHPAILTRVRLDGKDHDLWLSSVFGSYAISSEADIAEGAEVAFHCPRCGQNLQGTRTCEICTAHMARLEMREGGVIQICCRKGCRKHIIEFENLETEVTEFYRRYPIFWEAYHDGGDDDPSN